MDSPRRPTAKGRTTNHIRSQIATQETIVARDLGSVVRGLGAGVSFSLRPPAGVLGLNVEALPRPRTLMKRKPTGAIDICFFVILFLLMQRKPLEKEYEETNVGARGYFLPTKWLSSLTTFG